MGLINILAGPTKRVWKEPRESHALLHDAASIPYLITIDTTEACWL